MKVLFTTNIPAPYRIEFFNQLSEKCELMVLCECAEAKDREKEWLKTDNIKFNFKILNGIKMGNGLVLCPEIINFIKKNKFDIIVVGGYSTPTGMLLIQYLKNKKIPFIINCDGGLIKNDRRIKYKIKKYFISKANYYLSSGENTTNYLVHYGANKNNIFNYSFTSINEKDIININDRNKGNELKAKNNVKEEKVIIFVGSIIYRKGYDILLKIAENLNNNIGVYIIGGNMTEKIEDEINEKKLQNVHILEFKPKKELFEYYLLSDIFVFPTREDIWGLVINEAMANGLPIVTTNKCVAGMELIENGTNGYIVQSENVDELVNAINKIIDNNQLAKDMAYNNIEKIKKYTIENMAKEHIEIFKKIIKGK